MSSLLKDFLFYCVDNFCRRAENKLFISEQINFPLTRYIFLVKADTVSSHLIGICCTINDDIIQSSVKK
jgi:hypothetical protein